MSEPLVVGGAREIRRLMRLGQRVGRAWELIAPQECRGQSCRVRLFTLVSAKEDDGSRRPALQIMSKVDRAGDVLTILTITKPGRASTVLFLDDLPATITLRCPKGHDNRVSVATLQSIAASARMGGSAMRLPTKETLPG